MQPSHPIPVTVPNLSDCNMQGPSAYSCGGGLDQSRAVPIQQHAFRVALVFGSLSEGVEHLDPGQFKVLKRYCSGTPPPSPHGKPRASPAWMYAPLALRRTDSGEVGDSESWFLATRHRRL